MIGYYAGLRISEVYGLTWDDIDFEGNVIHVRKQLKQSKGEWYFYDLKNTASVRDVIIGQTLMDALIEEYNV